MKKQIFTSVLLCIVLHSTAQFVLQPLNYPAAGYWPYYISIADPQHVWIGTIQEFGDPYSMAVHTGNGGNSWEFDAIPVPGLPYCVAISSVDSNICYYLFIDTDLGEGTIWKTTDGGETWVNTITSQFVDGFADAVYAFDADHVVAVGDPNGGYYEIQLTSDGGVTWDRVSSSNIPAPLSGEMGLVGCYSASGNSIWFTTSKGRCYRSADRGVHWDVSQVVPGDEETYYVCFATELNGVFWKADAITSNFYITQDGGVTWNPKPFSGSYYILGMSPVPGFEEGFVFTAWQNSTDVYFTPNLFTNSISLDENLMSMGSVAFFDPSTGWLGAGESGANEIYKFTGVITSAYGALQKEDQLSIIPNPSATQALLKLPSNNKAGNIELRIYDLAGRLKMIKSMPSAEWITLDAAAFENGIYLIDVSQNNTSVDKVRWVVQH